MKKLKLLLLSLLTSVSLNAELISIDNKHQRSGLELLISEYDWDVFWEEFSIDISNWVTCKTDDLKAGLFGPTATMIEPLYLVDVVSANNKIESLGITLGSYRPDKSATLDDSGGVYVNVIKIPLFHKILKKVSKGLFAFTKGQPKPVYIGALDPKKWNDVLAYSMIPERIALLTPSGAIAGAMGCLSNTILQELSGNSKRTSETAKNLRRMIDAQYYVMGCAGVLPTGTTTVHTDPILTAKLATASVLADMHSNKGVVSTIATKHRVRSILNNYSKDIYCNGIKNPILPFTQYTVQLLYPTVGEANEFGLGPTNYAFKGGTKAGRAVLFVVNERKDYAAFAYRD